LPKSPCSVGEPRPVLGEEWSVQTEIFAQLGDVLRFGQVAENARRGIAREDVRHEEDRCGHDEHGEQRESEALGDVLQHAVILGHVCSTQKRNLIVSMTFTRSQYAKEPVHRSAPALVDY
jgi:hypothetical protein